MLTSLLILSPSMSTMMSPSSMKPERDRAVPRSPAASAAEPAAGHAVTGVKGDKGTCRSSVPHSVPSTQGTRAWSYGNQAMNIGTEGCWSIAKCKQLVLAMRHASTFSLSLHQSLPKCTHVVPSKQMPLLSQPWSHDCFAHTGISSRYCCA